MCALGKHTSTPEAIFQLLHSGMDIARISMNSVKNTEHKKLIQTVREASQATNLSCGICIDLQGPVIRICDIRNNNVKLNKG